MSVLSDLFWVQSNLAHKDLVSSALLLKYKSKNKALKRNIWTEIILEVKD